MANLALFVFLLEELPGFEQILNSTLHDLSNTGFNNAPVSQCNPVLGEMIWQDINKNSFRSDNKLKYEDNNVDSVVPDDISANIIDKLEPNNEESDNFINSTFLVAIFESVLNITAQTCGGTLISPRWVLTAVTCVDLLSHLYKNKNSNIVDSHYSIIANAVNPLIDGTVHNVTDILFHPTHHVDSEMITESSSDITSRIKIPSLALLRIEPPVNKNFIEILSEKIKPGLEVFIYSWVLIKNSSSKQDIMSVTILEAITLETNYCKVNYSFIEDNSLICLSVLNGNDSQTHLTSSGGPVVVSVENKFYMAAVAQLDSYSNFVGYLLHPYYSWIREVINK